MADNRIPLATGGPEPPRVPAPGGPAAEIRNLVSLEEGLALLRRRGGARRQKYGAVPTLAYAFRFDSKLEADLFMELRRWQARGVIRHILRQVPLDLEGGNRLRVDFLVFFGPRAGGGHLFLEAKGMRTEAYMVKLRLALSAGYAIREVIR